MSTCHGADESHGGRAAVTFQLRRGVDGWRGRRRRSGECEGGDPHRFHRFLFSSCLNEIKDVTNICRLSSQFYS